MKIKVTKTLNQSKQNGHHNDVHLFLTNYLVSAISAPPFISS